MRSPVNTSWKRRATLACATLLALPALAQTPPSGDRKDWTAQITSLPCRAFSAAANFRQNFVFAAPDATHPDGRAPFGVPFLEWTTPRFNALKARVRACGNPNVVGGSDTGGTSSSPNYAMLYVEMNASSVVPAVESRRAERDRKAAANSQVLDEIAQAETLPPHQQIAALQRILTHNQDPAISERINSEIEHAQDVAAEEDEATRRAAEADAAQQRLAEQQGAVEQAKRDHDEAQAQIARERAALDQQRRRTEAARAQAADAEARANKLRQQEAALAPARQQADAQRDADQAELKRLREQRADLEQQGTTAEQQAKENREDAEVAEHERRLEALGVSLARRNEANLARLNFAPAMLDSMIMTPNGSPGNFRPFVTLRQYLSVMASVPTLTIAPATGFDGTRQGFSLKRAGAPTRILLFRKDGNELYLDAYGEGDEAEQVSGDAFITVNVALMLNYRAVLDRQMAAETQ